MREQDNEDWDSDPDPEAWKLRELEGLAEDFKARWAGAQSRFDQHEVVRRLRSALEPWDRERLGEALFALVWRTEHSANAQGELNASELWRTVAYVMLGMTERQRVSEIANALVALDKRGVERSRTAVVLDREGGFKGVATAWKKQAAAAHRNGQRGKPGKKTTGPKGSRRTTKR